ncbi:MAG: FoF1 ATP synthase subunit delta/epsilon [Aestuariibaculum sp.]
MYLEIVSPEDTLFKSEVDSVTLPGLNGEFQVLADHVAIVSLLNKGTIKIYTHTQSHLVFDALHSNVVPHNDDNKILTVKINSGTIEMKDNKVIVLVD